MVVRTKVYSDELDFWISMLRECNDYTSREAEMAKTAQEKDLQRKMAQSVAGTAASMVPAGVGDVPLPPSTAEVIPSVDDAIGDEDDRETLKELVSKRMEIDAQLKPLDAAKDALTARIKTVLGNYGLNKLTCAGASINYFLTERKSINATKLMAQGVDMETIVACTDVTKSGTLKITPLKS